MGKSKPPAPPDPKETAQAQTATNVGTAIANANLGFVNQVTPQGNLTYDRTGSYTWTDPVAQKDGSRATYDIPTYTATTTMSPEMQGIYDANMASQGNLANLAQQQSGALGAHMAQPFSLDPVDIDAPHLQGMGSQQALTSSIGATPPIQTGIANAGQIAGTFDTGQGVQGGVADAGDIQRQLGSFDDITKSYGANDFSQDRQNVEDALMGRINPYIEQDREALRTQLINQGFQEGTEGFDRAMNRFEQNASDQRFGAIMNAGQEQSRLVGMDAARAAFQNAAQGQQFGQGMAGMDAVNQAQAQQYGQNLQGGMFANQAAAQQYGQNLGEANFWNTAQDQLYKQNAQDMMLGNQAAGQAFDQNLAGAAFQNNVAGQQFQQDLAGTQFNNNLAQQDMSNEMAIQNYQDMRDYQNRNQPINEISALLSGSQVAPPQFATTAPPQIPTVDYAGLTNDHYQQELNRWQAGQANNPLGTILSLGGMFMGI